MTESGARSRQRSESGTIAEPARKAARPARRGAAPAAGRSREPSSNPRKELVREELIDVAGEMFVAKGYAQTGMGDIAKALGLGRSAVYHYFRNKEEILAALVEAEALTPSHQLQELSDDPNLTASERLKRAIVDGIVRRLSSGSRFLFSLRLEEQIPQHMGALYNQGRRHIYEFYVRCIRDGVRDGEFRDVDAKIAAFAVIGMANWTSRWYSASGPKTPREIAEIIADLALQGLRKPGAASVEPLAMRDAIRSLREQIEALERLLP